MHLLLIRHAQSANNALVTETAENPEGYLSTRVADPSITALGVEQGEALGAWIGGVDPRPTRLYCSPMRRTIETAAPIAEALDLPLVVEDFLYERPGPTDWNGHGFSAVPGTPRSELAAITGRVRFSETVTERGWYFQDVETTRQAAARAARIRDWVLEAHDPDDVVAIVAHGAIGALLLSAILAPQRQESLGGYAAGTEPWWFNLANTSTSMIEMGPAGATEVHWINRVDHLVVAELVTGASAHATGNPGTR